VAGKRAGTKATEAKSQNVIELNGCRITRSVPRKRCDDYLMCEAYSECLMAVAERLWAGFSAERIIPS
jgi:hypothetical protein